MTHSGTRNPAYLHGMTDTPTYRSWATMLTRCTNQKIPQYMDYGGRGIEVCERWKKFSDFLSDMGERPPGTSIDRINNDGDYSPENCRWATPLQQNCNSRHNVIIEYQGVKMLACHCADLLGIKRETFTVRLQRGWVAPDLFRVPTFRSRNNPGNKGVY